MNVSEYNRVFGQDPFTIKYDEFVVDIGSGDSRLTPMVPDGLLIQIDPAYEGLSLEQLAPLSGEFVRLPLQIGTKGPLIRDVFEVLDGMKPNRVTMANALRYVPEDNKVRALEQMLALGQDGLTQLYPYRTNASRELSEKASDLGFGVTAQKIGLGGLRQVAYAVARINTTLTIEQQNRRIGPADQKKLAKLIVAHAI